MAFKIFCRWKTITTWYDVVDAFFFDMADSTLKACFLIYLVEIACSWMTATADHWLDRSLSTCSWSRYFAYCPCIFFLLSSTSCLLMRADLMMNFGDNFLMAASCWIPWPISSQYCCAFWLIDLPPQWPASLMWASRIVLQSLKDYRILVVVGDVDKSSSTIIYREI